MDTFPWLGGGILNPRWDAASKEQTHSWNQDGNPMFYVLFVRLEQGTSVLVQIRVDYPLKYVQITQSAANAAECSNARPPPPPPTALYLSTALLKELQHAEIRTL